MLLSLRLSAAGDADITGEDSLVAALGLAGLAIAALDSGETTITYDVNFVTPPGEVFCAVGFTAEDGVMIRSANSAPEVRGLLEIAKALTGRKIFTPVRPSLLVADGVTGIPRNMGRDS